MGMDNAHAPWFFAFDVIPVFYPLWLALCGVRRPVPLPANSARQSPLAYGDDRAGAGRWYGGAGVGSGGGRARPAPAPPPPPPPPRPPPPPGAAAPTGSGGAVIHYGWL